MPRSGRRWSPLTTSAFGPVVLVMPGPLIGVAPPPVAVSVQSGEEAVPVLPFTTFLTRVRCGATGFVVSQPGVVVQFGTSSPGTTVLSIVVTPPAVSSARVFTVPL